MDLFACHPSHIALLATDYSIWQEELFRALEKRLANLLEVGLGVKPRKASRSKAEVSSTLPVHLGCMREP